MTREFRVDGVLIPNRVRLDGVKGLPSAAWYGEAMTAGLEIDDPDGDLDLVGWHTFTADETADTAHPRIFSGWLTGRRISRGRYRTGAGRVWECDIIDQNALFSFEVFRASSAKRPAETDIERVAWARASAPMAGTPVADNGLFNTTDNPVSFGAADYVTQVPGELFASVAGTSGKNFFAYWDDAAEELSIFYDLVGSNPAAGIQVSNVLADVDNVDVFFPYVDAVLDRSPERIATGILFGYQGGNYVYTRDEDLIGPTEFSPDNWLRDEVYRTDRVGLQATAESLAAEMLASRAVEWDTVRVTVRVPAAKCNAIRAGDLLTCRFTHLPGYDPETPVPVIRRNVVPSPGRRDSYDVSLELSAATSNRGPGAGTGGTPGDGPYTGGCDPSTIEVVQSGFAGAAATFTIGATPTPGNTLIIWESPRSVATVITWPGFTDAGPGYIDAADPGVHGAMHARMLYRHIEAGDTAVFPVTVVGSDPGIVVHYAEFSGQLTPTGNYAATPLSDDGCTPPAVQNLGTVTPTANGILYAAESVRTDVTDTYSITFDNPAYTELTDRYGAPYIISGSGWATVHDGDAAVACGMTWTYIGCMHGGIAAVVEFACEGDVVPPAAGMHVKNERVGEGDGTTTTFTTRFPYLPGSLEVFVDGVPIILGITETDPDAGEFELDFAPQDASGDTRAEIVTVNYQAAVGGSGA